MQNGPDLAKRFYKELTDIQVSSLKAPRRFSSHTFNLGFSIKGNEANLVSQLNFPI